MKTLQHVLLPDFIALALPVQHRKSSRGIHVGLRGDVDSAAERRIELRDGDDEGRGLVVLARRSESTALCLCRAFADGHEELVEGLPLRGWRRAVVVHARCGVRVGLRG